MCASKPRSLECLSAAEVVLSVCGRQAEMKSISKLKHGPAGAKPQRRVEVDNCCFHKKQTIGCLFITYLPSILKGVWNAPLTLLLWHFSSFELQLYLNVHTDWLTLRQLSSCALCLSILVVFTPPVARSGTWGSQGVSPLPTQDPGPPLQPPTVPHHAVCAFQWTKHQVPQDVL